VLVRLSLVAVALVVASAGGPGVASAFISANTIDRYATYRSAGTRLRTSGPIGCSPGESVP
jgi:hypothetical protein